MNRFQPVGVPGGLAGVLFSLGWLLAAGCKVGPDYQRPAPLAAHPLPSRFSDTATNAGEWKTAEPSAQLPRGAWWEVFSDAALDQLEERAAAQNQQLAGALARLNEARASFRVARADLFPQVSLDPNYVRQ